MLQKNPAMACVIGCTTEVTVQYEGVAQELEGEDLVKYKKTYFSAFPDGPGRVSWPGITYFVVRPKRVRYCDYDPGKRRIAEMEFLQGIPSAVARTVKAVALHRDGAHRTPKLELAQGYGDWLNGGANGGQQPT